MKKLTAILAALTLIISTSAFADSGVNVSESVQTAFQKNFSAAKNVSWQKTDEFYFAHFELNKDDIAVAYNEEGTLVGASRIINREELPLVVSNALGKQYKDYAISLSVTEINLEGEISYYLNAENKTNVLRLKCSADGQQIGVEKRTKKKILVGRVY